MDSPEGWRKPMLNRRICLPIDLLGSRQRVPAIDFRRAR
jgi:hypothetical protein